jgi:hypothetical protein
MKVNDCGFKQSDLPARRNCHGEQPANGAVNWSKFSDLRRRNSGNTLPAPGGDQESYIAHPEPSHLKMRDLFEIAGNPPRNGLSDV